MGRLDWPWHRRRAEAHVPPAFEIASEEHELQVLQHKYHAAKRHKLLRAILITCCSQVALALSQSADDATMTRTRSEDEDLAAAKRQSLHNISRCSRAEALSYQYWDSNW